MKKQKTMIAKIVYAIALSALYIVLFTMTVFAGEPSLFTGTRALLTAVLAFLTGIVTLYFTVMGVKDILAWKAAEIEEKPQKMKAIKGTIIGFVLALTIGGVLTWISSFYS